MNALLEMARRGYIERVSADGTQGPFTDASGENFARISALKAVNGAEAVVRVRNVFGDSSDADETKSINSNLAPGESGVNMTLAAGEIELVTCYEFEVISGTVRAFINSNPPT